MRWKGETSRGVPLGISKRCFDEVHHIRQEMSDVDSFMNVQVDYSLIKVLRGKFWTYVKTAMSPHQTKETSLDACKSLIC
jgi:hypothetical protein